MTTPSRARRGALSLLAALTLAVSACSSPSGSDSAAGDAAAGWPRTVAVAGGETTIPAEPHRVAALSTETGDLALELVGHDRVVAVANGSVTPGTGNQLAEAQQVATALPRGTTPDPEQILSLNPDLVLMTSRHEGEEKAAQVLRSSGIPVLVFDGTDFESPERVATAVATLGKALGTESAADDVNKRMNDRRAAVDEAIKGDPVDTKVLLLMSRGGKQFVQGTNSAMSGLVTAAGGQIVGASGHAVPADPERIVKANPDVILVEDFQGGGTGPFSSLLANPALAAVPAIAQKQVHPVSASIASATAGTRIVDGYAEIATLLHPKVSPAPRDLAAR